MNMAFTLQTLFFSQKTVLYILTIPGTKISSILQLLIKHAYRDTDFRFITVHFWDYTSANINIDVSFSLFKQSLNISYYLKAFSLNIVKVYYNVFNMSYDLNHIVYISTGI